MCQQERFQVKSPPSTYLSKIKSFYQDQVGVYRRVSGTHDLLIVIINIKFFLQVYIVKPWNYLVFSFLSQRRKFKMPPRFSKLWRYPFVLTTLGQYAWFLYCCLKGNYILGRFRVPFIIFLIVPSIFKNNSAFTVILLDLAWMLHKGAMRPAKLVLHSLQPCYQSINELAKLFRFFSIDYNQYWSFTKRPSSLTSRSGTAFTWAHFNVDASVNIW